ncbi:MAG TPA: RagB/SusD family nutrient uptake outer membrane protein [Chitinophagaceae bacterium]|nr:RagB/SusD family nutrient uptake outer membrane protein [Chitinophagaceae bacterium]
MKLKTKIYFISSVAVLLTFSSCSKLLVEQPRSQITPQFFSTPGGILGGIAGVYSDMRNLWGTEGFLNMCVGGTDEDLVGGSGNPNFFTYSIVNSDIVGLWNIAYQDINTLNGVLQYGASANLDSTTKNQYLGQAKFLRAFYYFYLVQTYGPVPLHLKFITVPSTADSRAPIADIYNQIIQDLTQASTELAPVPTAPFLGKPATQPTALYLLAKAYLTRGWSSAAQASDFDSASTIASNLIANASIYGLGLWQDYANVNKPGNEYGEESLMVIDHQNSLTYGDYTIGTYASGPKENKSCFYFRPNYPAVNANYPAGGGAGVMTRDITNGRPFIRVRPNGPYLLNEAFADRINDSRWDNTFQTVWIANTTPAVVTPRGTLIPGVDTAIWTPPYEVSAAERASFPGIIFTPDGEGDKDSSWSPNMFPSMKKYDDPNKVQINDASTRPFIIFKFSEVYLIAAEAYYKQGDLVDAAAMLNVLRQRAAYRSTNTAAQNAAAVTAMTIVPSQVTLDFILDERTRELYGEYQRWWDLVRTNSLAERLQRFNPLEAYPGFSKEPTDYVLRPVPQTEIDLVTSGPPFPQNPGY